MLTIWARLRASARTCCLVGACVLSVWLGDPPPGHAQSGDAVEAEADLEARALFQAGQAAFADGRYEEALERFEAAYSASPRPIMLFNIGATAARLRRDARAISAYEQYLTELPDADNRGEVESRLRILREAADPATVDDGEDDAAAGFGDGLFLTWIFYASTAVFGGLAITSWLVGDAEYNALVERCTAAMGCTESEINASSVGTWDALTNVSLALMGVSAALTVTFFMVESWHGPESTAVSIGFGPQGVVATGVF